MTTLFLFFSFFARPNPTERGGESIAGTTRTTTNLSGGTVEQIALLIRQFGAIAPLWTPIAKDPKTISVVLDSLANILAAAEKIGELEKVSLHVEECGGLDRIEDLQSHENNEIYHKALAVLERYLPTDVNHSILWLVFNIIFDDYHNCSHSECLC